MAELAEAAGVGVDTVRFYQARGLIPPPTRRGRFAIYDEGHLERIRRIRSLLEAGFSLAQIRQLLESDAGAAERAGSVLESRQRPAGEVAPEHRSLLDALADRSLGAGTLTRAELAVEIGVPEPLVMAAVQVGLIQPVVLRGEERFPRTDLEMLRAALEIVGMGMPLDRLLELAAEHAANVDRLAEQAIDLFDEAVRKPRGADEQSVRRVFERLLPRATQVVALHFQRTVVARALERLRASGDEHALEQALEATRTARLEVEWR
ncbi:MAG: MerR family transcriptional regulator [Deltaproteobacteria bacterium]|nr:MerR family transcriptional regulator [Deltaproteobacteria bacterium]